MKGQNYLDAQARISGRGTMGDVDESPINHHAFRELPYDREVRERRRGRSQAYALLLVIAVISAVAYWWRHQ